MQFQKKWPALHISGLLFLTSLLMPTLSHAALQVAERLESGTSLEAFSNAIKTGDALEARNHYSQLQPQQKKGLYYFLKLYAEKNYGLAQWFYMDVLYYNDKHTEASKWLYIAGLGLELDQSLCKLHIRKAELQWTGYFPQSFPTLRKNETERLQHMLFAINYHKRRIEQSQQPFWFCLQLHPIMQTREKQRINLDSELSRRVYPVAQWKDKRQRALDDYAKRTGLDKIKDTSLSPDF